MSYGVYTMLRLARMIMTREAMMEMTLMMMLMMVTILDSAALSPVARPVIPWTRYRAPTQYPSP